MTNRTEYIKELFTKGPKNPWDYVVLGVLRVGEIIYSFVVNMWVSFYDTGHFHQHKLQAHTISVGNITAGGTGKTPFVQYLTRQLQQRGEKVAILSRGYRGGAEKTGALVSDGEKVLVNVQMAGDEPYLLAKTLPGAIVAVGRNRSVMGKQVERLYQPTAVVLDDGFQHWKLRRDLDILLIDATNPFSNGHVLPRGLLREPIDHLERAHLYVLTKADAVSAERLAEITDVLHSYRAHVPILVTVHRPGKLCRFVDWQAGKNSPTHVQKVVAMCALGDPNSFVHTLQEAGLEVAHCLALPDHHTYTAADVSEAQRLARQYGAQAVVVSEKDAVKLDVLPISTENIYVLPLCLEIMSGEKEFWDYLHDEWETGR